MNADDPKSYNTPDMQALMPNQLDDVGRALLSLTRELCVLTDRVLVMEQVLADNGIDIGDAIDTHQPDDALQEKIDAQTGQIVGNILASLQGK